jgi:hypothetical protein
VRQKNVCLVQSRPANQLYCADLQIEIPGQYGLYVRHIGVLLHGSAQLHHAAELIATAIVGVSEFELCVVLCRHASRLRLRPENDCEPRHKNRPCTVFSRAGGQNSDPYHNALLRQLWPRPVRCMPRSQNAVNRRKIRGLRGKTIVNIEIHSTVLALWYM